MNSKQGFMVSEEVGLAYYNPNPVPKKLEFPDSKEVCPICTAEMREHTVKEYETRTLMGPAPFADPEGNIHYHDDNYRYMNYVCSNGHDWRVKLSPTTYPRCKACAWPFETEEEYNLYKRPEGWRGLTPEEWEEWKRSPRRE